ncbi:class F sortase [Streptomyces katrae]|uniref:class F sortase n=1 Tax=Streptomyces katrae TaxID=68223 RepID=UPI000695F6EA|nr:class F sortase [Streptomyces katrae]
MSRARWAVTALTVTLLCTGIGLLRGADGADGANGPGGQDPGTSSIADALPSHALGLSGHRRLVRELEHSGTHGHAPARRSRTGAAGPLRPSRPLRLRIPSLGVDLPLAEGAPDGEDTAGWDAAGPAPGSAGTAVVTGNGLPLADLRRGRTIEIPRADHRTAVFTVERVSPYGVTAPDRGGRARLRLVSGETSVVARLTGPLRTG